MPTSHSADDRAPPGDAPVSSGANGVVTMNDVAIAAGLSRATVSKFFNGSVSLKPETRERIDRACRELQYVPDLHAVSLVKGKSNLVGVVLPAISEPFFGKVLQVIEQEAAKFGLQVVIQISNNDPAREAAALLALRSMKVHGIVITPLDSDRNRELLAGFEKEQRLIYLDSYIHPDCHFVMNDNRQSIGLMVNYLLSKGINPAYLGAPKIAIPSRPERLAGYIEAMERAGKAPQIIPTPPAAQTWQFEAYAYEQMLAWCGGGGLLNPDISGILCSTDRLALGAMQALRRFGRHPGRDIAVAGHDDIDICEYLDPRLTTVRQDIDQLGRAAVEFLQLEPGAITKTGLYQKRYAGRLVVRESA
ncbi:LacI family DNA-binding transcriptional regulator [Andreprevotia chitinilytica]|uniref:LacI family DNA-binding transcriptional regulator n=1 Tax=Andreprevotia chitinilytica TaxID=396808 RepID=UPI000A078DC6|nr:LacI family DNA-binding transcriptional regulator [Andreprevotia chitinilytica]